MKIIKIILIVPLFLVLWMFSVFAGENSVDVGLAGAAVEDVTAYLDAAGAAELLAERSDVTILDVRTPKEYSAGHIKGALNIDIFEDNFKEELGKLKKGKAYLVHCASGRRSQRSVAMMEELGFEKIYHLDGGFIAWKEAGNPVEIEEVEVDVEMEDKE